MSKVKAKKVLSLARMWSGIDGATERDRVRVYTGGVWNEGGVWLGVSASGRHGAFTKKPTLGRHKLMPSKCARIRPDIALHREALALGDLTPLSAGTTGSGDRRKHAKMRREVKPAPARISHRQAKRARMAHIKEGAK